MKRLIHDSRRSEGEVNDFDEQWSARFGPDDETKKFNSLEEFHRWLEEVKKFEPVHNKQV